MKKKPAFNPYLPEYEYVPDAEPYVFGDRVYIYGSHDSVRGDAFCLEDYVCWSAPVDDLGNWRYEGIIYQKTQDPANREGRHCMFAPDVAVGPDGRYYLYYGLDYTMQIDVAVCDTPAGKYEYYGKVHYHAQIKNGTPLTEHLPFDPAVLVDDDGKIYLYYGFCPSFEVPVPGVRKDMAAGCMVVELEEDMITMKGEPKAVLPYYKNSKNTGFEDHAFFEASSIRKIGDTYYLVYASEQMTELCYATSKYPDRGYTYGGTLVNSGDIGYQGRTESEQINYTGNIHGGMAKLNGQWYIFYHRHTHGTEYCRQGCAEPITIRGDGSIAQVEITSCGLNGGVIPAYGVYPAYIACHLTSRIGAIKLVRNKPIDERHPYIFDEPMGPKEDDHRQYIANINDGTTVGFKYLDFFSGAGNITVCVRGEAEGILEICLDDPANSTAGDIPLHVSTSGWTTYTGIVGIEKGVHAVYFVYKGKGCCDFLHFEFS